ncbi:MAG: hypothetical protein GY838_17200 [bacterium]|nr:hypothetical protein [bacterium]
MANLCACSDSTSPDPQPFIHLSVTTTGEAFEGEPYMRIVAEARNYGRKTVQYPIPCGLEVPITVTDSEGHGVQLWNPTIDFICPPGFELLARGETLRTEFDLIWGYDMDGTTYRVPPGEYTVTAHFAYVWDKDKEYRHLDEEIDFVLE